MLNPALVGDAKIFRLKGWEYVLIVRDDVVKEIKKAGFIASRFSRMKMTDSRASEKEKEARAKMKIQEHMEDGESAPVSSDRIESGRKSTGAIDSELQSMLTGLKERYMPGKELPVPLSRDYEPPYRKIYRRTWNGPS